MNAKEIIARRVAEELEDQDLVNLGIGLPTMVANYIEGKEIFLQSENGLIGLGPTPSEEDIDYDLTNAGGQAVTLKDGGMYFDSLMSFSIIRGGHVDKTILGSLQVDEQGNLANWIIPGKMVPGMGGAMDLVTGAKKVIIAMTHTNKKGQAKILKECTLPLTAKHEVDLIITEMGVIEVREDGLHLLEYNAPHTIEDIVQATQAHLHTKEAKENTKWTK